MTLATIAAGSVALSLAVLVPARTVQAAPAAAPSPVVHYEFDDDPSLGSTIVDSSGNDYDGSLVNPATATSVTGVNGSAIRLPGGAAATGAYVEIPAVALIDATDFTVSLRVSWDGDGGAWQRLFDIGSSDQRYLFTTPSNGDGTLRTAATATGAPGEGRNQGFAALPADAWHTVTVTADGEVMTTYLDGAAVDATSSFVAASQLIGTSSLAGYVGRSFYADPLLKGAVDDFQLFDQALSAQEVGDLVAGDAATFTGLAAATFPVQTKVGIAPVLPARVRAQFSDGFDRTVPASWDAVPEERYAEQGTFAVEGVAAGLPITATVTVGPDDTMTIDLGSDTGAFLGGAAGSLYGMYDDGMPSDNLLEGFGLKTNATKGQDGGQHPGSDALEVLGPLARATDGDIYIRPTDYYRGFPYQWPGDTGAERLADYFRVLDVQLEQVRTLLLAQPELADNIVIEPFNEPEGNMFGDGYWSYDGTSWLVDPADYFAAWDRAYRRIKEVLPSTPVAGPNSSILFDQVRGFLEHTETAGTAPDIMTWHELSNPAQVRTSIDRFRGWEDEIFGAARDIPINIDEYAFNYHTSVPGQMVQWISALEDKKADGMIAFWNLNGNLTDSAVQANRGNGQWWLYNAYAHLSGHTVSVTAPQPNVNYTLQGVATFDPTRRQARAVIGGQSGRARVDFTNVPVGLGSTVDVTVREIPWTGQLGDSAPPRQMAEFDAPVVGGAVTLGFGAGELPRLEASSAYEIIVSPAGAGEVTAAAPALWQQSYEAEDAAHTGTAYTRNGPQGSPSNLGGYYTSGGYDVGGLQTGSDVTLSFPVDVPSNGTYDLQLFTSTLNTADRVTADGPTNVFLSVDGAAEQELFLPLAYKTPVWDHTDTTVQLTAGSHTINVAATSLDGSQSTTGEAVVDRMVLSQPDPAASDQVYEAEFAQLDEATTSFRAPAGATSGPGGVQISGAGSATFWVYAEEAGRHDLVVDTAGSAAASVRVNTMLVRVEGGSVTVPLAGGVNKVVVSGAGVWLDRLVASPSTTSADAVVYEAEDATTTGAAAVSQLDLASGGEAVESIGGVPGNNNTLSFDVTAADAGRHAVTIRFANPQQTPATHYNPNPLARHADIWVNGVLVAPRTIFVPTFHRNQFWDRTVYLDLEQGQNTIFFRAEEEPNWDGTTYASDVWGAPDWPGLILRASLAPIIDLISVDPRAIGEPDAVTPPTVTPPIPVTSPTPTLSVTKVKRNQRTGAGSVVVAFDAAGVVTLSGRRVRSASRSLAAPGKVKLAVKARGGAAKKLRRVGKVKVKVTITATTSTGATATTTRKVVLIRR